MSFRLIQVVENMRINAAIDRCFTEKVVLKNITFAGKPLCRSLFFHNGASLEPAACNLIKKGTLAQLFSSELIKDFQRSYFTDHLRATASKTFTSRKKIEFQHSSRFSLHKKWSFPLRFLQQMWPNPQETAELVTFTEEIRNGKLNFFCSVCSHNSY